jgi:hypothetical protein
MAKIAAKVEPNLLRETLRQAIALRDEADQDAATFEAARRRAAEDRFRQARTVEDAERALRQAQEARRLSLVDAFIDGNSDDTDTAIAEAENVLSRAQRRLVELRTIEQELADRKQPVGHSIPGTRVAEAVREVVKNSSIVRRLCQDFETARDCFEQYHATLVHLAGRGMIPDDLRESAPKGHETYYRAPDPAWIKVLDALTRDADAELPQ